MDAINGDLAAVKADLTLDLKGLLCPIPVVKMAQAIKTVPVSGVIEATATDPGVMADIPAWCRTTGQKLVSMERQDKVINFVVQRVK
jgi:TusA-related sulfurtransferase